MRGDSECHTMHADQVLVSHGRDGEHPDLGIVHALIVSNLNGALDDVDIIILHPSDELYDLREEPVVVACLVCEVPPIPRIPQFPQEMIGSDLLSDLRMPALMFFLRFLGQDSGPSTLLFRIPGVLHLCPLVPSAIYGELESIIDL